MTDGKLLKTALYDRHVALEAQMGEEAGWSVPLSYRGALEEASAVRSRAGVFDMSHFGRIRVRGDGALRLLERACTADVARQEDDTTRWTLLCNERGGIIDRCRLIRLESFWVLVTSPLCRVKVLEHLAGLAGGLDAKVDDQTDKTSLLTVIGPAAPQILDAVLPFKIGHLPAGTAKTGSLLVARYIAERMELGGLWGVEVAVPNLAAGQAWRFITHKAGEQAMPPCGLAAWDVLRIEAGRPRYGHELNETIDPITAGLAGEVDFAHDFIGAEAVRAVQERGVARKLVGLIVELPTELAGAPTIPRQGAAVTTAAHEEVGVVTSGTLSAMLDKPIALAYVTADAAAGGGLLIEAGGEKRPARVSPLPFARQGTGD